MSRPKTLSRQRLPANRISLSRVAALSASTAALLWIGTSIMATERVNALPPSAAAIGWVASDKLIAAAVDLIASGGPADTAAATELAKRALSQDLLAHSAFRVLALTADDPVRSQELMRTAAFRDKADAVAHLWLLDRELLAGVVNNAVARVDIILRARPDLGASLIPAMPALLSEDARATLADVLASDPPWRPWFFAEVSRAVDATAFSELVGDLNVRLGKGPTSLELRPILDRLIADGEESLAFSLWLEIAAGHGSGDVPYAFNGDFERDVTNLPFDWSFDRVDGAEIETTAISLSQRVTTVLQVTFGVGRVDFRHVRKLLVLPPGSYILSGLVESVGLESARGLVWRIACGQQRLAETQPFNHEMNWSEFNVEFAVPSENCGSQWLTLEAAARTSSEQAFAGGRVRFDDIILRKNVDR